MSVPELDGYVWLGSNDPFDMVVAGAWVGYGAGTVGHRLQMLPGPMVASIQVRQPATEAEWFTTMVQAGIPRGGLHGGTRRAVVWDALYLGGWFDVESRQPLKGKEGDMAELTRTVHRLARPVNSGMFDPDFPDWVLQTYNC